MMIFIELWNPSEKWNAMTPDEQKMFIGELIRKLEALDGPGGIQLTGWGSQIGAVDHKLPYQLFALWQVPDEAGLAKLEAGLADAGWYEYVDQVNVAGYLLPSPTQLPVFELAVRK
jgi:hypothetical protein